MVMRAGHKPAIPSTVGTLFGELAGWSPAHHSPNDEAAIKLLLSAMDGTI